MYSTVRRSGNSIYLFIYSFFFKKKKEGRVVTERKNEALGRSENMVSCLDSESFSRRSRC